MRVSVLKPRIATANLSPVRTSVQTLSSTAVQRLRGRKLQSRNARLFSNSPLCVRCAAQGRTEVVANWDHVIPLYMGGSDADSNLQGLCIPHHLEKTQEDIVRYGAEYRPGGHHHAVG